MLNILCFLLCVGANHRWEPVSTWGRSCALLLLLCKWDVSADVGGKSPMSCIREKIDPSVSWKEVARKNNRWIVFVCEKYFLLFSWSCDMWFHKRYWKRYYRNEGGVSARFKIGLQKPASNNSFDFFSHYQYLLGALERILSSRRKSRNFENSI